MTEKPMKKRVVILLTGAAAAALLLAGCTSNPEDSIFDPNSGMPAIFEPLDDVSYEEEFHPEDWIEYDEEGEPILPDGVEKSDVFDDAGNFIGDPSMFGYVSGNGQNRSGGQSSGQTGGQTNGNTNVAGDNGVFVENANGDTGFQEGQTSEEGWSESYDEEDDGEWVEDTEDDGDDDSWVEDSEDSDDEDEDDGVELWNGTGEWNGY